MLEIGRDDWIRTSDPFVPNEVRYRAALHPEMDRDHKINEKDPDSFIQKNASVEPTREGNSSFGSASIWLAHNSSANFLNDASPCNTW